MTQYPVTQNTYDGNHLGQDIKGEPLEPQRTPHPPTQLAPRLSKQVCYSDLLCLTYLTLLSYLC